MFKELKNINAAQNLPLTLNHHQYHLHLNIFSKYIFFQFFDFLYEISFVSFTQQVIYKILLTKRIMIINSHSLSKIVILLIFVCISINTAQITSEITSTISYNLTDSLLNAKYTSVSFCNKQCVQNWNCKVSKQLQFSDAYYLYDNLTLTAGYIGYRADTKSIILALRGSSNKPNWWEDFNFQLVAYPRCKQCFIHAGFYFDFSLLSVKIYENIDKLMKKYQVQKVVCTGHSLGAAIALIAALQIKVNYGNQFEVQAHNFGQPRVGDINLAQFMKTKLNGIFRVIHYQDLVPHVPFEWLKYAHPPNQVFFSEDMKTYKVCNESGQDPTCSNQFYPNYNPKDHDFYFMSIDNGANCRVSEQ